MVTCLSEILPGNDLSEKKAYESLKRSANEHHRSLNSEVIFRAGVKLEGELALLCLRLGVCCSTPGTGGAVDHVRCIDSGRVLVHCHFIKRVYLLSSVPLAAPLTSIAVVILHLYEDNQLGPDR